MTNWAQSERRVLCDLFAVVGPDAPTLLDGWTTRDLAAHLIIREGRPDAAVGIVAGGPLAAYSERVRKDVARQPWPELVETVRSGPPVWSPMRLDAVDRAANTLEYFVHHEDVRRAQPDWEPRALAPGLEDALWRSARRMGRVLARRSPVGLVLRRPNDEQILVKRGTPAATVIGPPGELMLFLYGRQDHARVDIPAAADVAAQVRAAKLGL